MQKQNNPRCRSETGEEYDRMGSKFPALTGLLSRQSLGRERRVAVRRFSLRELSAYQLRVCSPFFNLCAIIGPHAGCILYRISFLRHAVYYLMLLISSPNTLSYSFCDLNRNSQKTVLCTCTFTYSTKTIDHKKRPVLEYTPLPYSRLFRF